MPIVIGLGSGRCGSHSLAQLLNSQEHSVCFHEINPSCMTWSDTWPTVLSMVNEFQSILEGGPRQVSIDYSVPNRAGPLTRLRSLKSVRLIGDVAFYYLSYVPQLAALPVDIKFPCLKRDKESAVNSFLNKVRIRRTCRELVADYIHAFITGRRLQTHRNHWIPHNGTTWRKDRIWDKCHPKFSDTTLKAAIEAYYDLYYATADTLSEQFPDMFQIFPIEDLNSEAGQKRILEFCRIPGTPYTHFVHSNLGHAPARLGS